MFYALRGCLSEQGAASTAETTDIRQKTVHSGTVCAVAYKDLLDQVNQVSRCTFISVS